MHMYYSNSDTAKPKVDSWYQINIVDKGYDSYVAIGMFCEQAKVKGSSYASGNATMDAHTAYTPNFKCTMDGNGKGIVKNEDGTSVKVGLITYDEVIHAGGHYMKKNSKYYLYNESYDNMLTMSPGGVTSGAGVEWIVGSSGRVSSAKVYHAYYLRPVINLNTNVLANGTGTSTDPYVVITK